MNGTVAPRPGTCQMERAGTPAAVAGMATTIAVKVAAAPMIPATTAYRRLACMTCTTLLGDGRAVAVVTRATTQRCQGQATRRRQVERLPAKGLRAQVRRYRFRTG